MLNFTHIAFLVGIEKADKEHIESVEDFLETFCMGEYDVHEVIGKKIYIPKKEGICVEVYYENEKEVLVLCGKHQNLWYRSRFKITDKQMDLVQVEYSPVDESIEVDSWALKGFLEAKEIAKYIVLKSSKEPK